MAANLAPVTEEPASQVNQVNTLIDQLATSGELGVGSPLTIVAHASAMPVASPDKHEWTQHSGIKDPSRSLERRMKTVVVTGANKKLRFGCALDQLVDLTYRHGHWLF